MGTMTEEEAFALDEYYTKIDRRPFHTLITELHEVAGHRVEPDSVRISYAKIFGVSKVNTVIDTINVVDFANNEAKSATRTYRYDYLCWAAEIFNREGELRKGKHRFLYPLCALFAFAVHFLYPYILSFSLIRLLGQAPTRASRRWL